MSVLCAKHHGIMECVKKVSTYKIKVLQEKETKQPPVKSLWERHAQLHAVNEIRYMELSSIQCSLSWICHTCSCTCCSSWAMSLWAATSNLSCWLPRGWLISWSSKSKIRHGRSKTRRNVPSKCVWCSWLTLPCATYSCVQHVHCPTSSYVQCWVAPGGTLYEVLFGNQRTNNSVYWCSEIKPDKMCWMTECHLLLTQQDRAC